MVIEGEALYEAHCSQCHETGAAHAPARQALQQIWPEVVVRALAQGGVMAAQGSGLTEEQKRALARAITGKNFGEEIPAAPKAAFCSTPDKFDALKGPNWDGWGANDMNTRFQPAAVAKLPVADIPKLRLKWAFAFPGALVSNTHPIVAGGRMFIASWNRTVYALDANSGCIRWAFETSAFVRGAPVLGLPSRSAAWRLYFGDAAGRVYALDATTGKEVWTARADDLANLPKISGSVKFHNGLVFVPVTSMEELTDENYECCKVPGKLVAFDAASGAKIWEVPTISEPAHKTGVNKAGIAMWGPSGAGTWSSPTIDAKAGVVYITTGDNHSHPTTDTSDSILALDMQSGKILWQRQFTKDDAFNGGIVGCFSVDRRACPIPHGDDYDFASSAVLITQPSGKRLLIAGQKSGVVHAIDPDREGAVVWETRVASGGVYGGIEFGIAVDDKAVYAPISDVEARQQKPGEAAKLGLLIGDRTKGGGLAALDLATGKKLWAAPAILCAHDRPLCLPAQTAAVTVIPGAVFSGSLDGHIRAYSASDGAILWDFDTVRTYEAVDGVTGRGGSIGGSGPVVVGGMLYTTSGDSSVASQPGNVLLAFSVQ
jgi:polyvinyl alcohol dehydrogenase (cytochrome)